MSRNAVRFKSEADDKYKRDDCDTLKVIQWP